MASSTGFGYAVNTGCGVHYTKNVLDSTGFIPIAAAQSMMNPYSGDCNYAGCNADPSDITCTGFDSKDPYGCNQTGSCWCGKGTQAPYTVGSTAPLGCLKCAYGQFVNYTADAGTNPTSNSNCTNDMDVTDANLFGDVHGFVVIDTCPYAPQPQWCPYSQGDRNQVGMYNHFDIAMDVPDIKQRYGVVANYVAFTPMVCPDFVRRSLCENLSSRDCTKGGQLDCTT